MKLFFSRVAGAGAALALQFLWPRLALVALAAVVLHTRELAWVLVVLLVFVLVPRDDTGPTLWSLAIDAAAIALQVAARDAGTRTAVLLAALAARPCADTAVTRAMKVFAALMLGALARSEDAAMRVALVLLFGPLYALYGVFQCCLLVSAQMDDIYI